MKKKALALLLAMAMTATMAGCGLAATTAPDNSSNNDSNNDSNKSDNTEVGTYGSSAETQGKTNPIVVKVSNGAGETSPGVKAQLSVFAPMVENNSKGNIGVEVYSGAQLGDDTTAPEMVVAGQLEINNTSTAPLVGYVPELGIFDIPFLFADEAEADKVLASEVGDYLNAKLADKGIINLAWNENGFRELTNSKHAVATVADVAGLKIRTMENAVHMATYTALGATPTAMAWGEIFSALQQGTVDGQENPLAIILTAKVYEVQKYITMIDLFYSPCVLMINEDIYNNFTDEQKEAFDKAAEDGKVAERQISQELASSARATMEAEGVVFTDVNKDEWVAAVQSVYDDASLKIDQDLLAKIKAETAK